MVGHTGSWEATLAALATIDACLARVVDAVQAVEAADPDGPGALLAITADHGNADCLRDADGHPVTAHSLNPVPLVLIGRRDGRPAPRGRRPGGRRPDPAELHRHRPVAGHDRPFPLPVVASAAERTGGR